MSERFVWDKFNVGSEYQTVKTALGGVSWQYQSGATAPSIAIGATDFSVRDDTARFYAEGSNEVLGSNVYFTQASLYKFIIPVIYSADAETKSGQTLAGTERGAGYYWYFYRNGSQKFLYLTDVNNVTDANSESHRFAYDVYSRSLVDVRGNTNLGKVSGAQKTYPDDGVGTTASTRSTWYVFLGTDTIDPISISYAAPEAGEPITVILVPSAGKKYGGTVSYLYQYSTNGGKSWTNAGSRTTDTEKEITVPENAEQFQARVLASDDLGFTSSTYVTGENLNVQNIHAFVGVNDRARAVTNAYVGVNGVARKVVRAYVGDASGIARRWM